MPAPVASVAWWRDRLLERIAGRRVVASISGGKDSAAMSLWLTEQGVEHDRVFMDTGWEHPETYDYLRGPLTAKLGPIKEIRGARTMEELIRHKGMFPGRLVRFCTQELKVFPARDYLRALPYEPINAVGIRAAESEARARFMEWEWLSDFDCDVWRPLLRWTEEEVIGIHRWHGLAPNPLYLRGASRVGCWPCIFSRKAEIRMVADTDPGRIDLLRQLESDVQAAAAARYARHGESLESKGYLPPTFFSRRESGGETAMMPIDQVVRWARTGNGGRQFDLFAPEHEEGCVRWGVCEPPAAPETLPRTSSAQPEPDPLAATGAPERGFCASEEVNASPAAGPKEGAK